MHSSSISRRDLLKLAASAGAGMALGYGGLRMFSEQATQAVEQMPVQSENAGRVYPFYGTNQAGIATSQQRHMIFAAFDVETEKRAELRDLLRIWSEYSARMSLGEPVGEPAASRLLPPEDNGENLGLNPAGLTVTFGFGSTLFKKNGTDRFGLSGKQPAGLVEIPPMAGDALQADRSGGDLCVQVCADDPQVAFHAIRHLIRSSRGVAAMRWMQQGFLGIPKNPKGPAGTPRNLFGFKDGTQNIDTANPQLMNEHVWVNGSDQPAWMRGGTYLAARRIRMLIEVWDRSSLDDQEKTFGRTKASGAPFGKKNEFDPVNPDYLPKNSHVRLARGDGSIQIHRRGYSYNDGIDPKTGQLDAGLFFISYQRSIAKQLIPMLHRLSSNDALNEYTLHTANAVFAVPPGASKGGFIGETLFI
ncbi:iron uptake transporter deferrochelatase/peroxidase subunit [Ferviditalea candida]|uniref:Deferrochelatase n=1 Tax=Ferviditalea candida TaxID=3108399 RepID=A0ABU5ZJA4_9BACL|nr:iron uptake transporter deferrochelatase/peroxidase subunit [Paenibacillaceae bacterium T2]